MYAPSPVVAPHPFAGAEGILKTIGNTPLIRLGPELLGPLPDQVSVFAKAEWANPGGSVKDRPALAMVLQAEREGLRPGDTLLDASSGNTGIALAMIAGARGYRLVLSLPANANLERKRMLAAYGAELHLTDPLEGSDGAIRGAQALAEQNPGWRYLDQYSNDANWLAHFGSTGPEIWAQTHGQITHFVATVGTSGTFTGTTRYLKSQRPELVAVEVQPDAPFHGLEGLKHMESALVPRIYTPELADQRVGAPTEASYDLGRRLARRGLLVGPSGAAAIWAAARVAKSLSQGVVVTVLPDGGTRYLSDPHLWEAR